MSIDRLPNHSQMLELIYQQTLANLNNDANLSDIERKYGAELLSQRNGKLYCTEFYKYATNTTASGTRLFDSVGKTCEPSTDTTVGRDDFLGDSIIFSWDRCNYVRDEDGTARLVALHGTPMYKEVGAVDVGTISATFYWKYEDRGDTYRIYMSDSPNHKIGLVPWIDAVKADGTVLPYYVISAFPSVTADDGLLRSQPNKAPAHHQSYNNMITSYQKKGKGYWGAGASRNTHGLLFQYIKFATKDTKSKFKGCLNFSIQVPCDVAETGVKRVLTTNSSFYVGACVSVGTGEKPNRNVASANDIVDRARIASIESVDVDGKTYNVLNLDIADAIDTATTYYISSMPCFAGETDAVIGKYDGSYMSNTDWHHTYRIHGVEYNWGQYFVKADTVLEKTEDSWDVYVAQKGTPHVANAHTNYIVCGKIPATKEAYTGDMEFDESTGSSSPCSYGGGSTIGTGCYLYANPTATVGSLREELDLGSLGKGAFGGLSYVFCWYGLSGVDWLCGSCD